MKNEPALTESGSAGSMTMPLRRRSPSTASRTSASGALPPTGTPSARASSAYRSGPDSAASRSWNVTDSTTRRSWYLKTLERYSKPHSAAGMTSTCPVARSYTRTDSTVSATSCP